MNILAFDTVTESLSIAIVSERLCDSQQMQPGVGHSRLLLSEVDGLLDRNGMNFDDIDLIGVGIGPGSFTGVRIGVAAAQAMAFATDKPVIGISSLAAMVNSSSLSLLQSGQGATRVLAIIDARMGEVYAGFYEYYSDESGEAQTRQHGPEQVVSIADLQLPSIDISTEQAARWRDGGYGLVLATSESTARSLTDALTIPSPAFVQHDTYPSATALAQTARARFLSGDAGDPMALVPSYVRNQVAKTARQR